MSAIGFTSNEMREIFEYRRDIDYTHQICSEIYSRGKSPQDIMVFLMGCIPFSSPTTVLELQERTRPASIVAYVAATSSILSNQIDRIISATEAEYSARQVVDRQVIYPIPGTLPSVYYRERLVAIRNGERLSFYYNPETSPNPLFVTPTNNPKLQSRFFIDERVAIGNIIVNDRKRNNLASHISPEMEVSYYTNVFVETNGDLVAKEYYTYGYVEYHDNHVNDVYCSILGNYPTTFKILHYKKTCVKMFFFPTTHWFYSLQLKSSTNNHKSGMIRVSFNRAPYRRLCRTVKRTPFDKNIDEGFDILNKNMTGVTKMDHADLREYRRQKKSLTRRLLSFSAMRNEQKSSGSYDMYGKSPSVVWNGEFSVDRERDQSMVNLTVIEASNPRIFSENSFSMFGRKFFRDPPIEIAYRTIIVLAKGMIAEIYNISDSKAEDISIQMIKRTLSRQKKQHPLSLSTNRRYSLEHHDNVAERCDEKNVTRYISRFLHQNIIVECLRQMEDIKSVIFTTNLHTNRCRIESLDHRMLIGITCVDRSALYLLFSIEKTKTEAEFSPYSNIRKNMRIFSREDIRESFVVFLKTTAIRSGTSEETNAIVTFISKKTLDLSVAGPSLCNLINNEDTHLIRIKYVSQETAIRLKKNLRDYYVMKCIDEFSSTHPDLHKRMRNLLRHENDQKVCTSIQNLYFELKYNNRTRSHSRNYVMMHSTASMINRMVIRCFNVRQFLHNPEVSPAVLGISHCSYFRRVIIRSQKRSLFSRGHANHNYRPIPLSTLIPHDGDISKISGCMNSVYRMELPLEEIERGRIIVDKKDIQTINDQPADEEDIFDIRF